jgi:histidinol dehydrogenase
MTVRTLSAKDDSFPEAYSRLLSARGEAVDAAIPGAAASIAAVKQGGLDAVLTLTERFDGLRLTAETMRVSPARLDAAIKACDRSVVAALEKAAQRIADFHIRQFPSDRRYEDDDGVTLGWRWSPVDAAGLYAPGGLAAYPSSVLMNALPAKAAGVPRIVMATPPGRIDENPAILAAARIAGVDEVWAVGGAQAIAAMAYGAGPFEPVDVIVGPGNAYVAAAKKLVFGDVGIDSIAGPSEVFIIADGKNDPAWIAADLLSQAEHDEDAQSILFTDDVAFGAAVIVEAERQIAAGYAGPSAAISWPRHGAVIIVESLFDAIPLINQGAPEHLQIATSDAVAERLAERVRHAGAIFLGRLTPEALGDYVAGPNHVLPTGRRARFASGLFTQNFMKRTTIVGTGKKGFAAIGPTASALAHAEGLPAHAYSVDLRLKALSNMP